MKNRYIELVIALSVFLCFESCGKIKDVAGYGYMDVTMTADAEISDVLTRAETLSPEDYASYNIALYKKNALVWKTDYLTFVSDNSYRKAPAGDYLLVVESCTAEEAESGNGRKRLEGKSDFTITAGKTSTVPVACKVVNAMITIGYDDTFLETFSNIGVSLTDGRRKVALELGHNEENAVYYNVVNPDGKIALTYTLAATLNESGNQVSRKYDVTFDAAAGMWNKVTLTTESE